MVVVSAGGEEVVGGGGVVDEVVDAISGEELFDDRDDVRASSDEAPPLHAVPTRARVAIRTPSRSTR